MTFIGQRALDIRRKLQKLHVALRMNPSQRVDIAFKVYNAQEARKEKQATMVLETERDEAKGGSRILKEERPSRCQSTFLLQGGGPMEKEVPKRERGHGTPM